VKRASATREKNGGVEVAAEVQEDDDAREGRPLTLGEAARAVVASRDREWLGRVVGRARARAGVDDLPMRRRAPRWSRWRRGHVASHVDSVCIGDMIPRCGGGVLQNGDVAWGVWSSPVSE